jgi:F0F1-type ATP synthase membrane subunit b/b'
MDATIQALGAILLKALPTLFLLIVVHLYLKWMLFGPLRETLRKRSEATEGARKAAEASMANATAKAAEIEKALRDARNEVYREQEEARKQWIAEQSLRVGEARKRSHEVIRQARAAIVEQTESAKQELAAAASGLADQISRSLLDGRPM